MSRTGALGSSEKPNGIYRGGIFSKTKMVEEPVIAGKRKKNFPAMRHAGKGGGGKIVDTKLPDLRGDGAAQGEGLSTPSNDKKKLRENPEGRESSLMIETKGG